MALAGVSFGVTAQAAAAQAVDPRGAGIAAPSSAPLPAMDRGSVRLTIPRGSLESGLVAFTEQAGVKLVYPTELTEALETDGLDGEFSPIDALTRLLEGTGLTHRPAGARRSPWSTRATSSSARIRSAR